jgi:EmrB/QacA subfamily drug resistance transporter
MLDRLSHKPPGYRFTIGRILAIYAGLMVTMLLAALDQAIVATALPRIVSDLGGITQYAWVFTAYMLTSTVTVPLYGKLGDVYGRKYLFLFAICVFLVGSALCGLAQGMTQLVIFRAVQGIGAGGIIPLAIAVTGSIVPPRDRGRYQGLTGAVFVAASVLGPALGGFIVDHTTWRWIFFVNLPIGVVALLVIWFTMPRRAPQTEHAIDWLGAGVLAAATASLLLGLVWGGEDGWTDGRVLVALAAAGVLVCTFAIAERRAREPILPFDVLRDPIVGASVACTAFVAMTVFGVISYVPLFVQGVIGTSATASGVVLTPFMLGAVVAGIVSGQLISRTGRYRWNVVLGPPVLTAGMLMLWRLDEHATNGDAAAAMVVAGIGMGSMMQVFVISVQTAVPHARIGSATALLQFARQMGATLGVTIIGTIVNHGLPDAARGRDGAVVHRLPPALREALASALQPAFLTAAIIGVVVWVIALVGVKEVPLATGAEEEARAVEALAGEGR